MKEDWLLRAWMKRQENEAVNEARRAFLRPFIRPAFERMAAEAGIEPTDENLDRYVAARARLSQ